MTNPRVIRRFIILCVVTSLVGGLGVIMYDYFDEPPGDYETRAGSIHLDVHEYEEAIADFDLALAKQPDHRGALMGKAIAYLQMDRYDDAEAVFRHLISYLEANNAPDDLTGKGVLAAAYANLGILYDRQGEYRQALDAYIASLRVDDEAVSGPGFVHKILHDPRPSTVRDRARYIWEQLQLPEDERVMYKPEEDQRQRMYKP